MPPKKRQLSQSDEEIKTTTTTTTTSTSTKPLTEIFDGIVFCFSGTFSVTQTELTKKVEGCGASTSKTCTAKVTHLVSTVDDFKKNGASVSKALKSGIPIVTEGFITKSIEASKKLDEKDFSLSSSTDDDEEEEEEEEEEKVEVAKPTRRSSKKAPAKSEEEEEDSNNLTTRSTKKTKTNASEAETKTTASEEFTSDLDDSSSESEDEKNQIRVKIKGRAANDPHFPDSRFHVYENGKDVYDATLNQTEISQNNNKFYIIQLLEADDGSSYSVWNRWGREGLKGLSLRKDFSKDKLNQAISLFCSKFYEKTKNTFADRANFKKVAGKYDMIELDYSTDKEPPKKVKDGASSKKVVEHKKECSLDERVQDLIKLIFDVKMMKRTMTEAKYDLKKMPLGKLSKNQITKGYMVLKQIEDVMGGKSGESLSTLSSRFYTIIPHAFGMSVPPVINTNQMLIEKMNMLQNLADIEIATNIIKDSESDDSNILESHYAKLKTDIQPLDENSQEYKNILLYVKNTYQGAKKPTIVNIFKIARDGEADRYDTKKHLGNRKLLWHGSRLTNYASIISQGLRIAPPEAPVSGYRFGKGVYFADCMSLSANYCRTTGSNDFCMLLGDVALGKTADLARDTYMEKPQPNSHSTWALGTVEPDPKVYFKDSEGCITPYGQMIPSQHKGVSCYEHQYVVYDVAQVHLKYLLQLKN
ncbi:hypothetical protein ACTFIV_006365 [Dictyostelium citrinum]